MSAGGARARERVAERFSITAGVATYQSFLSLYLELVADDQPVAGGRRKVEAND